MAHHAIRTKFLGPSTHRGARVKATTAARSLTLAWNYGLNTTQNHMLAAQQLAEQLGWDGTWSSGSLPDGSFAHVLTGDQRGDPGAPYKPFDWAFAVPLKAGEC